MKHGQKMKQKTKNLKKKSTEKANKQNLWGSSNLPYKSLHF